MIEADSIVVLFSSLRWVGLIFLGLLSAGVVSAVLAILPGGWEFAITAGDTSSPADGTNNAYEGFYGTSDGNCEGVGGGDAPFQQIKKEPCAPQTPPTVKEEREPQPLRNRLSKSEWQWTSRDSGTASEAKIRPMGAVHMNSLTSHEA